ncbi:GPIX protein, partial [Climacteris rufus]|nr:GPIX protein [Climacteris rufus]
PALPWLPLGNHSRASVPAGALDGLRGPRELGLAGTPWHCDCRILYLKLWLEDFSAAALAELRCASPEHLRAKPLSRLTGNELGLCRRLLPTKCVQFFWRDLVLIAAAIITLILVAWALKFSRKLVCQLILGGWMLRRHRCKSR